MCTSLVSNVNSGMFPKSDKNVTRYRFTEYVGNRADAAWFVVMLTRPTLGMFISAVVSIDVLAPTGTRAEVYAPRTEHVRQAVVSSSIRNAPLSSCPGARPT